MYNFFIKQIRIIVGLFSILFLYFINANFAQTAKDGVFQNNIIEELVSFKKFDSHITLKCIAKNLLTPIFINISFPNIDAARIQITTSENQFNEKPCFDFDYMDENDSLIIFTKDTRICISKINFNISIYRGTELIVSQRVDIKMNDVNEEIQIITEMNKDEHFYGFGEKFNGLDQKGKRVVMELNDAFMSDDDSTYKSIPFFLSSKRYGLLVNSYQRVVFNMGNLSKSEYDFTNPNSNIEYFVFTNKDPLKILTQYTSITGRSPLIPKWSLEPWLSRRRITGWKSPNDAEADIDMILEGDYRLGVVLWEGFRVMFDTRFGNQANLLSDKWHKLGIKQVCWDYTGHITITSPFLEYVPKEYFIRYSDSSFCLGHRSKQNLYIDPTNNEAMNWWEKTLYEKRFFSVNGLSAENAWNLDGVKLDFSELFPKEDTNLLNIDKSYGMHNHHAVAFSEQIYNWLQTVKPDGGITWVRGGGLGLQKVGFSWGGDRGRTFEQLRGTVRASLAASVSGISLIGHDLGGYRGGNSIEERKVYIRGVQYSTFSPSFHDHGSAPAPWEQNKFGRENYNFYSRVRYNILPYLYHYVKVSNKTGIPIMRTLFMLHPDDENTFTIEDEYYFGDNILVAPILSNSNDREIYLPKGNWIDFWTQEKINGKQFIQYKTPINRIPLFVKEGTILPLKLNDNLEIGGFFRNDQKNNLLLTFRFFKGGDSDLKLFDDEEIEINKIIENEKILITAKNINQNYGLIIDGVFASDVLKNGKKLGQLSSNDFGKLNEGWIFDESKNQLLIKVKANDLSKVNNIEILKSSFQPEFKIKDKSLVLTPPEILKIIGWNKSIDIYFSEVSEAEYYKVKYWETDYPNKIYTILTAEPFVTITDLQNEKNYGVNISSVNGDQSSRRTQVVIVKPNKRKPFFKISDNLFLGSEHYLNKSIKDSVRTFTYGIISPSKRDFNFWIKVKTGDSHFKYFRWYKIKKVNLDIGINYFTLNIYQKEWIPSKLYFSADGKERPFLKNEIEGDFEEHSVNIQNEKILDFDGQL
ncbi:MAG: hypothetical protein HYS24_09895 [Ignavibacteriales bacterium]|nr:hypothetical protein [Ignavibacteriales bacterium]